jgi:ferritin-like metal-binding protein YciE
MKTKGFRDLFELELKDLYSAEEQLVEAFPKMAESSTSEELREAFESHLEETVIQMKRLERIFHQLDVSYGRVEKCRAMEGLIAEAEKVIEEGLDPHVLDAAMICAAQRVEHYEIAGYGCARTFAQQLGHDDIADLLQETLDEEGEADRKLTEIALDAVNMEAAASNAVSDE